MNLLILLNSLPKDTLYTYVEESTTKETEKQSKGKSSLTLSLNR